jgi:hypothetical protein
MKTHTPTPYRVVTNNFKEYKGMYEEGMNIETDDTIICSISGGMPIYEAESNAQFIITACNCHDELLNTLKRLTEKVIRANSIQHSGCIIEPEDWSELYQLQNEAKVVIAKSEGKE